jgi:hypothetical protein
MVKVDIKSQTLRTFGDRESMSQAKYAMLSPLVTDFGKCSIFGLRILERIQCLNTNKIRLGL